MLKFTPATSHIHWANINSKVYISYLQPHCMFEDCYTPLVSQWLKKMMCHGSRLIASLHSILKKYQVTLAQFLHSSLGFCCGPPLKRVHWTKLWPTAVVLTLHILFSRLDNSVPSVCVSHTFHSSMALFWKSFIWFMLFLRYVCD